MDPGSSRKAQIDRFRPWCSLHTPRFSLAGFRDVARVLSVYDGDTMTVVLEHHQDEFRRFNIRIYGIDTPEMKSSAGSAQAARQHVLTWLQVPEGSNASYLDEVVVLVRVSVVKEDKYGRLLGRVTRFSPGGDGPGFDLAASLLQAGCAQAYSGGKKATP